MRLVVHQTWPGEEGKDDTQARCRASWRQAGFALSTADDAGAEADIARFANASGLRNASAAYAALQTAVQRSDMWRYAILWMEGGVYADVDVCAFAPMAGLAKDALQRGEAVLFTESMFLFDSLPRAGASFVGRTALNLGLTDLVRFPQRRNCVMVSPPEHPLFLSAARRIVSAPSLPPFPAREPTFTLERTGPGLLTDAADEAATGWRAMSRWEGHAYFLHVGQGSWKAHRGALMRPHEWRLCAVSTFAFFLLLAASYRRKGHRHHRA